MEKLEKRSGTILRYFTNFMLGQYALVHYFIYFHLSWDIMEPITVILANFDLFIAYYFFIFRGRSWTLEGLQKSFMDRKRSSILRKNGVNMDKYEELLQIRDYLKFRLGLVSKNPYALLETLEKPLKLLDTR